MIQSALCLNTPLDPAIVAKLVGVPYPDMTVAQVLIYGHGANLPFRSRAVEFGIELPLPSQ
ncbi:MAG: hypothetical protein L0Z53_04450, partial [Acidobacteriales bacterium]|nr:hypothetical protein [Terriglobales bacterium]